MKHCVICGMDSADDAAPTCSACGEASWTPSVDKPAPVVPPEVETVPAFEDIEPVRQGKRGRR